jgi:hypothetical protein
MGKIVKIKSGNYHFFLDGRRVYIKTNSLGQQFIVKTFAYGELTDDDYVTLMDAIYRKRIINTNAFNTEVFSKYRLCTTTRILR